MTTNIEYIREAKRQLRILEGCINEIESGKSKSEIPNVYYNLTKTEKDNAKTTFDSAKNAAITALNSIIIIIE